MEASVGHGTINFEVAKDVEVETGETCGQRGPRNRVLNKEKPQKDRGGWWGRRKRETN